MALALWLIIMALPATGLADIKKALKFLEKGEYVKLVEMLQKSIEKDSINPETKYLFSVLYLTKNYPEFHIDTSYFFILGARANYQTLEPKDLENLKKDGITDSSLLIQQKAVELQAFMRAKGKSTLADYNYFLDRFLGADQIDSVIAFRNEIAFEEASFANTYEAFQQFIHKYPDALQIEAATYKYEELLYLARTADKKLESYIRFVKNNPTSPFRTEAERNIFEISTASHDLNAYMTFLELYPRSPLRKKAMNLMYHVYKQQSSAEGFSNMYGITKEKDSLIRIANADFGSIMAIFEMEKYGFASLDGTKLIDFTYTKINEKYFCGDIKDDYLEVADDSLPMIVSRLGGIIYIGDYDSVEDLGYGALKVTKDERCRIIHKSGVAITDSLYEDAKLVARAFISYKENGKWGLRSFCNRPILPAKYDDISASGPFIIIRDDSLLAMQNIPGLAAAANQTEPDLQFIYDDFDLIRNSQLLVFSGTDETVLNASLEARIPLGSQNFYELFDAWMVKKDNRYKFYDQIFYPLSELEFDLVDAGNTRVAMKYRGKWGIFNSDKPFPSTFEYDSIHFLSDEIGILKKGSITYAMFDNDSLTDISYSVETRLLRPGNMLIDDENRYAQYLLTRTSKGIFKVFNTNGQEILDGKYKSVEALGREYIIVEKDGKKGLLTRHGKEVLKPKYDAIGNYDRGYVSTLIDGKFGIYNAPLGVALSTNYQKALKPYGKQYFIGSKGNLFAIVNLENKEVTKYEFDEIRDWNDSIALVKKSNVWGLYNIRLGQYIYEGISEFKELRDGEDKLLLITRNAQLGVLSNIYGEIIGTTFNDIINVGSTDQPVFFAEKYIREAAFYIVIYYDQRGKILRKQIFTELEEYEKIYCG